MLVGGCWFQKRCLAVCTGRILTKGLSTSSFLDGSSSPQFETRYLERLFKRSQSYWLLMVSSSSSRALRLREQVKSARDLHFPWSFRIRNRCIVIVHDYISIFVSTPHSISVSTSISIFIPSASSILLSPSPYFHLIISQAISNIGWEGGFRMHTLRHWWHHVQGTASRQMLGLSKSHPEDRPY